MSTLNRYSLALILSEGSFSCVKASRVLGFVSHDALTRELLNGWQFSTVIDWASLPANGTLVVDDTVIAKPYSEKLDYVRWSWSSSEGRTAPGISLLLALWVTESGTFPVFVGLPGTENRNTLFRQFLKVFQAEGPEPSAVLMDAWYASSETLNLLHSFGWTYVCRIKSNRKFNAQALDSYRFNGARSRTGRVSGVKHKVQIVKHHDRFIATNELTPHTSQTLEAAYRQRWVIETVFRALKGTLHLEKCSCRNVDSQLSHILCALEALNYLRTAFPTLSVEQAQQEMIRQYRCPNCRDNLFQLLSA